MSGRFHSAVSSTVLKWEPDKIITVILIVLVEKFFDSNINDVNSSSKEKSAKKSTRGRFWTDGLTQL